MYGTASTSLFQVAGTDSCTVTYSYGVVLIDWGYQPTVVAAPRPTVEMLRELRTHLARSGRALAKWKETLGAEELRRLQLLVWTRAAIGLFRAIMLKPVLRVAVRPRQSVRFARRVCSAAERWRVLIQ